MTDDCKLVWSPVHVASTATFSHQLQLTMQLTSRLNIYPITTYHHHLPTEVIVECRTPIPKGSNATSKKKRKKVIAMH